MKHVLCFFTFFFLLGCSSSPKRDFRFIEIPTSINEDPKKNLSSVEVKADLEQLDYALQRAYSGRRFLPANEFQKLRGELEQIKNSDVAIEFCRKLASAFDRVSDNHLRAKFKDRNCFMGKVPVGSVGRNYHKNKSTPWNVHLMTRVGHRALLISITSFPQSTDPVWKGFIPQVQQLLSQAELVIIDLRGNGGGDDTIGQELADLLAGLPLKTPFASQWTSRTPESSQIFVNSFEYWIRQDRAQGKPVEHLQKLVEEYSAIRDDAASGKIPLEKWNLPEERRLSYDPLKSVNKPIYLLMDKDCASSCESTIDFFEFNPYAKKVGENTAGFVHFGNNGRVFLQNSGISVQMAMSYNAYFDGRFIEKKGLTPNILVPEGRNAMEFAWTDFLSKVR